jgi:hypothetical protein
MLSASSDLSASGADSRSRREGAHVSTRFPFSNLFAMAVVTASWNGDASALRNDGASHFASRNFPHCARHSWVLQWTDASVPREKMWNVS